MNILVTNDDGVTSPGLLALAKSMRNLGTVSVLAPDRNWSGSGHVKTLDRPLRIREVILADGSKAYTSDGAPSDCVALALLGYLNQQIDLVVFGINPIPNLGYVVTYSGTITDAMKSVIWGVPGIAFSIDCELNHTGEIDYLPSVGIAKIVANFVLESGLPDGVLLNVNIPYGLIRTIQTTHQGMWVYREKLGMHIDSIGNPYYWIGGETPSGIAEIGTNIKVQLSNYDFRIQGRTFIYPESIYLTNIVLYVLFGWYTIAALKTSNNIKQITNIFTPC